MNSKEPTHFSDYFKIDKSVLKEMGVFDPILNFDTKVFVEPLLLKNSASEVIRNAYQTYKKFFSNLLILLEKSTHVSDKCWRSAQKMVSFPEYQYTCIGYSSGNTDGRGSGTEFNDKIFQSAKEIVELAQGDPEIFLLLPLLEEGIAGDRISDMVQNIIDDDICRYTVDIMAKLGIKDDFVYITKQNHRYDLLLNPYSKQAIKLLPKDILLNLPVADNIDAVVHELAEYNERLRNVVNRDIGYIWLETTKAARKAALLNELKTNKSFFIETLKALKEYSFEHYDLEKDYEGLYKWLADSKHFTDFELSKETRACSDNIDALLSSVAGIISYFKNLIECNGVWQIFWASYQSQYRHVREYYSQMIFYTVCSGWLTSQNSNIKIILLQDKNPIRLKFIVSDKFSLVVHIKHANNTSLLKGYMDALEKCRTLESERHIFLIMNFEEKDSEQFKAVKVINNPVCNIFDITIYRRSDEASLIDFAELGFEDDRYTAEKRKGGASSYKRYEKLRTKVRALCQEELNRKIYYSAMQLCEAVVNKVVNGFPELLSTFEPYEKRGVDGHDWTKPTFYNWCNGEYKAFKRKSIVVAV
jgi:hypothetical protein